MSLASGGRSELFKNSEDSPLFRITGRGGGFIAFGLRRCRTRHACPGAARSLVSPSTGQRPQDYVTEYLYDSFGRLQALVYPDGEALRYGYNSGGLIDSAVGVKAGVATSYLSYLGYDKFEQRVQLISGNGVVTDYTYRAADRRLVRLTAGAAGAAPFQQLAYAYDAVGNITGLNNQVPLPKPGGLGGPVSQRFGYDELDRLTRASGTWQGARNEQERYTLTMAYDAIHNITHKSQTHVRGPSNGRELTQAKTTYDWAYAYTGTQPHAPTQIDGRRFSYDANGNQTGWTSEKNASRRTLVWDEENRLRAVADNGHTQRYIYDASGERIFKWSAQGETAYVNQYFTVRNGTLASKHVFIGSSRLASTLVPGVKPVAASSGNSQAQSALRQPAFNARFDTHPGQGRLHRSAQGTANAQDIYKNPNLVNGANPPAEPPPTAPGTGQPEGNFRYFFHPDHLGSSSYVTDGDGKLYEHLQYFPFGETWVEQASNSWRTPYRFTGKELDEETGLYYFGARYYDPRTSVWQSVDPILQKYLPMGDPEKDRGLPGLGGVFNAKNLNLFHYAGLNPLKFVDPDGNSIIIYATSTETGRSIVRSRTGEERAADARAGNNVNVDVGVPTYRVYVGNESGETFSFNVTRHAFRDRDGDRGLENKTFKGEGWFRGALRDGGGLGERIELRDFETNSSTVTEPDGKERSNIQIHVGPGASDGCTLICGGKPKRDDVMGKIKSMLSNDREAGYGDNIIILYDRLNDAHVEVPE